MVKHNQPSAKMETTYYLKPGQTLENTKVSDRSLALMVSQSAYDRFVDYTTENERRAAAAKREAAKLADLKKATYEMSKSWDNAIANIAKRRKEELLGRKKRDEEARIEFVKDLKARNSIERAKIVNEARKLLLWKKPQCRLINGALLTSECYRQLDAQTAFNKTLQGIDEKCDREYAEMIKEEAERGAQDEGKKAEERMKKNRAHGEQLKRQIEEISNDMKLLKLRELQSERQDLKNMAEELRMVNECEAEQMSKRKKELKEIFLKALDDKKRHEADLQRNDDFENRALEVFARSKDRIKKIGKLKREAAINEKLRHAEAIAKKCVAVHKSRDFEEAENLRKALIEKEELERAKREEKKKNDEKLRLDMEKYREELEAVKKLRATEEKDIQAWETLQRFKRDEFNKEIRVKELKRERTKKIETANHLRNQMAEREAELQREGIMGDDSVQTRAMIQRTNENILAYGEEVLNECKELNEANPEGPKRPLFPILKVIHRFKNESGLIPPRKYEECKRPRKFHRKRPLCAKPLNPDQIVYV